MWGRKSCVDKEGIAWNTGYNRHNRSEDTSMYGGGWVGFIPIVLYGSICNASIFIFASDRRETLIHLLVEMLMRSHHWTTTRDTNMKLKFVLIDNACNPSVSPTMRATISKWHHFNNACNHPPYHCYLCYHLQVEVASPVDVLEEMIINNTLNHRQGRKSVSNKEKRSELRVCDSCAWGEGWAWKLGFDYG